MMLMAFGINLITTENNPTLLTSFLRTLSGQSFIKSRYLKNKQEIILVKDGHIDNKKLQDIFVWFLSLAVQAKIMAE